MHTCAKRFLIAFQRHPTVSRPMWRAPIPCLSNITVIIDSTVTIVSTITSTITLPLAPPLNFELQHFPVRQLAGPDRSGNLPYRIDLIDRMVKNLACYLTDHKQKSINSSWLEIAIWPQIWSLAPFILNVFKCPFKSLIWTPPHPHRPFSCREILNSAAKCILWRLRARNFFRT